MVGGWVGLLAGTPVGDHCEQVVGSGDAVAVDICIRIIAAPGRNNCKHVIHADKAVTADIRTVWWTLCTDRVAAAVNPITSDLIGIVATDCGVADHGAAPGTGDPAAAVAAAGGTGGVV